MGYEVLIVNLLLMVVSVALQMAATPTSSNIVTPEAGKLDTPTIEEGNPIGVIFGTVIKKNANCVWYGDSKTVPIKTRTGGK